MAKVQKTIDIPEWNEDVRSHTLQFWEARGVRFTDTEKDLLEGSRGNRWSVGLPQRAIEKPIALVVALIGPQEIITAIESTATDDEITIWDRAYWLFELDSLGAWLLRRDRLVTEWKQFDADLQRRFTHAPHPGTYRLLRRADGFEEPGEPATICPPDVARAIRAILQNGILAIRVAGWQNDAGYCALEADHLHNLPDLLGTFTVEKLKYYLEIEVPSYLKHLSEEDATHVRERFDASWKQLEQELRLLEGRTRE